MKLPSLSFLLSAAFIMCGSLASAAAVYQCPMHPWIKSDSPGARCTICGMALVATASGPAKAHDAMPPPDAGLVTLTPAQASVVGVQTSAVRRAPLERTLHVTGVIVDDDTRHRILAARVPGRIEKLHINFVGAEVREGEPLATIFSPEMLTAQRTYVERIQAGPSAFTASERAAARERLLELGLTGEEIMILEHTLQPTAMLNIRAPMSGTVVSRAAYEGQYVAVNDPLFEVADFSSMWFVFDAYEPDLAWIRSGQEVAVETDSLPGRVFTAPVAFIDPNFNEATRTARVRVVLPNDDRALRNKQNATGTVHVDAPGTLLVPRSAILQHGGSPVVFVAKPGSSYEAHAIRLGRTGDRDAEVLAGLSEGDLVVTEGALILDGQAQLAHAAAAGAGQAPASSPIPAAEPAPQPSAGDLLQVLAFASADAAAALANDDLPGYQKALPGLRHALDACLETLPKSARDSLVSAAGKLEDGPGLDVARRGFEPFSTAVADTVRASSLPREGKLWIFECPMTPVLGNGRWLSRTRQHRNPFFGSAMPDCGSEVH